MTLFWDPMFQSFVICDTCISFTLVSSTCVKHTFINGINSMNTKYTNNLHKISQSLCEHPNSFILRDQAHKTATCVYVWFMY